MWTIPNPSRSGSTRCWHDHRLRLLYLHRACLLSLNCVHYGHCWWQFSCSSCLGLSEPVVSCLGNIPYTKRHGKSCFFSWQTCMGGTENGTVSNIYLLCWRNSKWNWLTHHVAFFAPLWKHKQTKFEGKNQQSRRFNFNKRDSPWAFRPPLEISSFGMDEVNIECDEINKDIFQTQTHLGFIIYGVLWTSQW